MPKKHKLEPIRLEDLVNSPFSQGLESVLRFQPPKIKDFPSPPSADHANDKEALAPPSPVLDAPDLGAPFLIDQTKEAVHPEASDMCGPNTGASNTEAPLPGGSEPVASTAGSPQIEADKDVVSTTDLPSALAPNLVPPKEDPDNETPPLSHALSLERLNPEPPKTEAVNSGAPLFGGLGFISQLGLVYREAAKPRPWVSVQDAHTHAEQNLYQTLFNRGKPIAANARGLVIGVRTLARLVPMAYSNCHANLKSLVDKLAIEERPADRYNDGRLFLIYTEEEILRRRRAAGLTHVLKRTRGVSLINPLAPNTEAPVLSSAPGNPGASESESPTRRGAGKSTAL